MNSSSSILPAASSSRALPDHSAGTSTLALPPTIEHRTHRQRNCGDVDGGGGHQERRGRLVTADVQDNAVERITKERLNQRQVREVAIKRRRGAFARLLDRCTGTSMGVPPAAMIPSRTTLGQLNMVAVAGCLDQNLSAQLR